MIPLKEIGSYDSPDVWSIVECGHIDPSSDTDLDIMLPNGFVIALKFSTNKTLSTLKDEVFEHAKRLPLKDLLLIPSDYIFFTISSCGEYCELYDETRTIFSLNLFVPLLSLQEREGNVQEKQLSHDIGLAIGHPLSDIESKLTLDYQLYRMDLYNVMEEAVASRGVDGYSHYAFPENASSERDSDIPPQVKSKIEVADLYIEIWYRSRDDELTGDDSKCIFVRLRNIIGVKTLVIVANALSELVLQYGITIDEQPAAFVLQIVGQRCFLTRDIRITSFEYVRSCFESYRIPKFLLRRNDIVMIDFPIPQAFAKPSWLKAYEDRFNNSGDNRKRCSLWELDDNLKIRVYSASHITISDIDRIYVKVALYHGSNLIISKESECVRPSNPRWTNGWIDFDIYLKDLPCSVQICFSLIAVKEKKKEEHSGIGWVNMRLFNWNNEMLQGKKLLYLWPFSKNCTDFTNSLGQTGSNDNRDAARLEVEFCEYDSIVEFPSSETIHSYVKKMRIRVPSASATSSVDSVPDCPEAVQAKDICSHLENGALSEEQQQHVWSMREYVAQKMSDFLPLLAHSMYIWLSRDRYSEFYELLDRWAKIKPETAIILLDCKYSDRKVREFAVNSLDQNLDDDRLYLYVMPLVQALKLEPFVVCALSRMLLKRALCNYRIGHIFFWLLRAEIAQIGEIGEELSRTYIRLSLLIEAYCRGNFTHMNSLLRQVDMVARLTNLSKLVKAFKDKDSTNKKLQSELELSKEAMQNMSSPLNPSDSLGNLNVELCNVIGSAKLPLRLSWSNAEPLARLQNSAHQIIFKNGDDLRQDMLTLHVLRIMDALWKENDFDMCLSIYEVLPMGKNVGMIHVIQNCSTLFEIQCAAKQLGSTFNMEISLINKWIRTCSEDSKVYLECVDRFSASCAGYSVATYVLGIKDRHQDNIMLTRDGRLFHIDFGHFLGHYKKKLGINRDRVPFVLTDHFLFVIAKGKGNYRESHEYKKFRQLCVDAYSILHDRAKLFISLFTMMLYMGLPELQNMDDINFLRSTLCVGLSQSESNASFHRTFDEAFSGAWSTKTNWFFHSVKHL